MTAAIDELARALLAHKRVAVIAHVSPDGDTLGSSLAIARALEQRGVEARVTCHDAPPAMYAFLPGVERVVKPDELGFKADMAFFVDVSAPDRAGDALRLAQGVDSALIDHHATNPLFCPLCVVRERAASTGEMALELIRALGVEPDREMGVLLYAAIATDTGNFSYSNTTPEALRAVADLISGGLDIDRYNRLLFRTRSLGRTRLTGWGLSRMRFACEGRLAYVVLTPEAFAQCGASRADTEGLVNFLIETQGVEAAFLAEERPGALKVSMRSLERVDVARVAAGLGGGGHARAAGVTLNCPPGEALERILDALKGAIEEQP